MMMVMMMMMMIRMMMMLMMIRMMMMIILVTGVWEDNDPSLSVQCAEGRPRALPRVEVTQVGNIMMMIMIMMKMIAMIMMIMIMICFYQEVSVSSGERVDCAWSAYGPWSQCSKSCNRGSQIR